jgi:hypothetical protein
MNALFQEARRMTLRRLTPREQIKNEILISARVHALKELAEDTAEAYERAVAASGMTREHFRLRAVLLGIILPPPPREDA